MGSKIVHFNTFIARFDAFDKLLAVTNTLIYVLKHVKKVQTSLDLTINGFLNKFSPVFWLLAMFFQAGFDQGSQPISKKKH